MKVAALGQAELGRELAGSGLTLVTGGLRSRIVSPLASVAAGVAELYGDCECVVGAGFADFHVAVAPPAGARRWYRPQVLFRFDGRSVFKPLPRHQAFPMLEWGLNWCVTTQVNHYLLFHAAVVARDDRALVMPGPPGSGKSTLCAALVSRGWRLLSDEVALVALDTGAIHGLARPVSLKNAAIGVIRRFAPQAHISTACPDTLKGTVAHLRPPAASVARSAEPAQPAWILFPRFVAGAALERTSTPPEEAFPRMVNNAFNYSALGTLAFQRTADLVAQSTCHDLVYSDLEEAVAELAGLP